MAMIVLGMDSGIERTGYAIFHSSKGVQDLKDFGCIFTDKKDPLEKRLLDLQDKVNEIIDTHHPDVCVLEQLFYNKNVKSGIAVAQAQGAVIAAIGRKGSKLEFLKPQIIKQSLTGYGNADKKSVQKMVMMLLNLTTAPKPDDTVDAIACGLTYCTMMTFHDRQD